MMQVVIQQTKSKNKNLKPLLMVRRQFPLVWNTRLIPLFITILKETHDIPIDMRDEKIWQTLVLILLAFILNMLYGIKTQYKNQSMIWTKRYKSVNFILKSRYMEIFAFVVSGCVLFIMKKVINKIYQEHCDGKLSNLVQKRDRRVF